MKQPKNQHEAILFHLLEGNSITSMQAFKKQFGYCTRLSARIFNYKELGLVIKDKWITKNLFLAKFADLKSTLLTLKLLVKKLLTN